MLFVLTIKSFRVLFVFFQAEDGIRDLYVTGVQTCALPISAISRTFCTMCCAARGQSETMWPRACCMALRNTGRPTFSATRCVFVTTPKVPPWPERSEERRVGKECRCRCTRYHDTKS